MKEELNTLANLASLATLKYLRVDLLTQLTEIIDTQSGQGNVTVFAPKSIDLQIGESHHQSNYNINLAYFYGIECDRSTRIRAYSTIENLLVDASRSTQVKPLNHECLLDVLITKSTTEKKNYYLNPVAVVAGQMIYLNIDNLSNQPLNLSLKYMG